MIPLVKVWGGRDERLRQEFNRRLGIEWGLQVPQRT